MMAMLTADSAAEAWLRGNNVPLVRGQRGFGVAGVRGQGQAQLGPVEHGQVGAFAGERGHQVGGVAQQGDPGDPVPAVAHRQRVDRPRDQRGVRPVISSRKLGSHSANSALTAALAAAGSVKPMPPAQSAGTRRPA